MFRHSIVLAVMLAVMLAACAHAPGQPESGPESEQEILAVIQELFDAMATGDAERAAAVLLPEGQWVSVRPGDDGAGVVAVMPHRTFLARLGEAGQAGERWIERMWDPEVMIHGPIAVVWTPYDFARDDVFSHCGVDAFTLVRTADGWRIAGATYTVETVGCP
jgi:hypothetical protein